MDPSPRPRFRRLVRALVLVAAAGLIAGVLFVRSRGRAQNTAPPFQTVTVDRADVVQRVVTTGELNPILNVQVGSQVSGMVQEILVDFNSPVSRGQVIARIDPAIFEANVRLAEAELASVQAGLELAHLREESIRSLSADRLVSTTDVREAEVARRQAEALVAIRQQQLEKARLELDRCTIVSPTDGIVIARNIDVGQTVAASLSAPVLFRIADDLARMQIETRVAEADVGVVREGQRVEFRVDAHRDRLFSGRVEQIRNAPVLVDNVVTYDAIVHVANPELKLKPGMTAEVRVITAESVGVLRVANAALRARLPDALRPPAPTVEGMEGHVRIAYRLVEPDGAGRGRLEAVVVRTGISDGLHTEVLEGLREGDVLVTGIAMRRAQTQPSSGQSLLQGQQAQF